MRGGPSSGIVGSRWCLTGLRSAGGSAQRQGVATEAQLERLDQELLVASLHPPVLDFIRHHAGLDDEAAYGTLNMGAGFALFVADEAAAGVLEIAGRLGIAASKAGRVERGAKQLLIEPLQLRFGGDALALR